MGTPHHGNHSTQCHTKQECDRGDDQSVLQSLEEILVTVVLQEIVVDPVPESAPESIVGLDILDVMGAVVGGDLLVLVVRIVCDDLVDGTVGGEPCKGLVDEIAEFLTLLGEDESVVLDLGIGDIEDPQVGVPGCLCGCDGTVDDLTIGLSCQDILDNIGVGLLIDDVGAQSGGINPHRWFRSARRWSFHVHRQGS